MMTPASFKAAFPAFVNEDNTKVQRIITNSLKYLNADLWGSFLDDGLGNLVAHKIVVENRQIRAGTSGGGDDGTVISKKVGTESTDRSADLVAAANENPFRSTPYGREYWRLAKQRGGAIAL